MTTSRQTEPRPAETAAAAPTATARLREVALLLSEAASRLPGAVATRLGGDEFCLIARDRSGAEVMATLDDLVRRAGGLAAGGVSSGVASSQAPTAGKLTPGPDKMDPRSLLRHADAALYRAKRAGGGRQELSDEPQSTAGEDH